MRYSIRIAVLFSSLCLFGAISLSAQVLTITFQETNLVLTAAEFSALPHTEIKATDPHEKKEHQYSVVPVRELLSKVGAPLGDKLRGAALHYIIMVRAQDGYAVAFTLADFDDAYTDRPVFLADRVDGNPLSDTAGPLRLIVPDDKKASRWARMVTKIEIIDVDKKQ